MSENRKRLNIAFLTALDPKNRRSWSGSIYYIAQALTKHCGDITYLGPMNSPARLAGKIFHKALQRIFKKNFAYNHSITVSKNYAKIAARKLANQSFDVIIAPSGATEIAFLETDIPIVLIEDATFALLYNYHQHFSNLLKSSVYDMNTIQQRAITRANLVFHASEWAARSATEIYNADKRKVHVISFGANFEEIPTSEIASQRKKSDQCRLLFIGVNWERKGGDIAFETLQKLEEHGIQAELVICGCTPPKTFSHERMTVIPFLDKNDETQRKELENLYIQSDFLLFPTRNECYGIVVCEANAYGLPVLAANTGGVPGLVENGVNGYLLPYDARGDAYAEIIANVYQNDRQYAELVKSCRATFEDRLNWDAWGEAATKIIYEMLDVNKTPASSIYPLLQVL